MDKDASSTNLLKAALREYNFELQDDMLLEEIRNAQLDDLDLIEALELIERLLGVGLVRADISNCATFADIVALVGVTRTASR